HSPNCTSSVASASRLGAASSLASRALSTLPTTMRLISDGVLPLIASAYFEPSASRAAMTTSATARAASLTGRRMAASILASGSSPGSSATGWPSAFGGVSDDGDSIGASPSAGGGSAGAADSEAM